MLLLALTQLVLFAHGQEWIFPEHPNGFVPSEDIPCEPGTNKANGLNYFGCNNSGKCQWAEGFVGFSSTCICCDPYNVNSWCYGGLDDGSDYEGFILTGTQCASNTQEHGVTFGWRFETDSGDSPITCNDVDDAGVVVKDCTGTNIQKCAANTNIHHQVEMALRAPCSDTTPTGCNNVISSYEEDELYDGLVLQIGCQTCTEQHACVRTGEDVTDGSVILIFMTFFNTYYDPGCAQTALTEPILCPKNPDFGHKARHAFRNSRGPDKLLASITLRSVLTNSHPYCGTEDEWENACSEHASVGFVCGIGQVACPDPATYLEQAVQSKDTALYVVTTKMPTPDPTPTPTIPTPNPTAVPTAPADPCWPYINHPMDHKFIGAGTNCRAGILPEWPGGIGCKSPYIVCLPLAHTPKNPDPAALPNLGKTPGEPDYSILECAEECAYDQRCTGFEFNSTHCILIDDIEIIIEGKNDDWPQIGATVGSVTVVSAEHILAGLPEVSPEINGACCTVEDQLDVLTNVDEDVCRDQAFHNMKVGAYSYGIRVCTLCSKCTLPPEVGFSLTKSYEITGRLEMAGAPVDAQGEDNNLCFAKRDYCHPYFEAEDLNDVMLKCYCPNNRKGTYTKKVKRTVANTRFCDSGYPEVERRIQKAQANRMFHLCENWCLFETDNPKTESWYWNPWHRCWREQYAGTGVHMSYCNRVIRNPNTIEQHFINTRSDSFCKKNLETGEIISLVTEEPTGQPSVFTSTWYLADEEDTCDEACADQGKLCDEGKTNSLVTGMDTEMNDALQEASNSNLSCPDTETGKKDWALPAIKTNSGMCVLRHPDSSYTGCNWAVGVGYKRLCACYSA